MHAASPLTSISHAHDDELGCHRLAAGGGLGGRRATSFISSDRSLLRDTSGVPASALFCPHSGSFFFRELFLAVHAASPLTSSPNAHDDELGCHRLAAGGGFGRPHHTQTPTHCLNLHEHTHTQTHFHMDIDTRTEAHTLPQLTRLHTSHCTLNR